MGSNLYPLKRSLGNYTLIKIILRNYLILLYLMVKGCSASSASSLIMRFAPVSGR
ncbi:hypothetical protein GCM10010969_36800 [Saccharibacillus kuerlensis]|uniref:Uncharacterized protein n=1 Tax=Saccharibacillus kuerlensis TaxID=459527 RepID=A0ABQ2L9W2_9BACL|nr:hypothetical protein GCM10010969_36800 [Saccharibacillus kuerlensis]